MIIGIQDIISPTRVHHPTEESKVVSAEEAQKLFKEGWYPRRKFAQEAKGKVTKITSAKLKSFEISSKDIADVPSDRRKELGNMKFFALRAEHKKVVGGDNKKLKTNGLIKGILEKESK